MDYSKIFAQTKSILFQAVAFMYLMTYNFLAFAQDGDKGLDIDVDIGSDGGGAVWYTNPIIWVIVALFVIVIVALSTRGKSA